MPHSPDKETSEIDKTIDFDTLRLKDKCKSKDDFLLIMAAVYSTQYQNDNFNSQVFESMLQLRWQALIRVTELEGEVTMDSVIQLAVTHFGET